MIIYVKAIPRSGKAEVTKISDGEYKVKLKAAPEKNKANRELVEVLAKHFGVPRSRVGIKAGKTARTKMVSIDI